MSDAAAGLSGVAEPVVPVVSKDRYHAMDVLRGFALLGILGPNILAFAWPSMAMNDPELMAEALLLVNPEAAVHTAANQISHDVISVFFFGKMMFLFSLLFGAGVVMYAKKFEAKNSEDDESIFIPIKLSEGWWLWYRRMGWLMAIGLFHAVVLWYGDILVWYAACGLGALWWVRKWSPKAQLLVGGASYLLGTALMTGLLLVWIWSMNRAEGGKEMLSTASADELRAYTGTYLDALKSRAIMLVQMYLIVLPFGFFWMCSGIMMMGMALARLGVLTGERSAGFYAKMAGIGLPLGLAMTTGVYWALRVSPIENSEMLFQGVGQLLGIPTALGYAGLVILIVKLGVLKPLTTALAAVGRMALSNYLLHTIIGTTLFYSHGVGLFATVQFPELWYLLGGIWAMNIVFSVVWLRFFRFGPAEWLWRSLTYWAPQPMLRGSALSKSVG